jgi:hypothetical protein
MASSSYYVAWQMTNNFDLLNRVAASVQQESEAGTPIADPEAWAREHRWDWATQTDWVAAVQAAQDSGITEWGRSPSVVTDQHILSYVQAALAP